jgi:hypothetical protein
VGWLLVFEDCHECFLWDLHGSYALGLRHNLWVKMDGIAFGEAVESAKNSPTTFDNISK